MKAAKKVLGKNGGKLKILTGILAVIIVFITVYSLMLPVLIFV